eukprot:2925234-Ditylum_brightwellii.AAC.1
MHNWLPLHTQAKKFNSQASDLCPVCVLGRETSQHLFQCTHESSVCSRIAALTQLYSDLTSLCTAPILKDAITASVAQWCGLEALSPVVPTDSVGTEIVAAKTAQLEIGWANFLKGRVSVHWATAQT